MDPKNKYRIQSNYNILVDNLKYIVHKVTDEFITNDILTVDQKTNINKERTDERKFRALLDMMLTQGKLHNENQIYQVLCEVLDKEKCGHVKQMLVDTVIPEGRFRDGSGDKPEEDMQIDDQVGDESGDKCEEDQKAGAQGGIDKRQASQVLNFTNCSNIEIGPKTVYHFHK